MPLPRLVQAAREGSELGVRGALRAGDDVNEGGGKGQRTPLHMAAQYGHVGIIRLLVAHGADLNKTNADQRTPLHFAAAWGKLEAVKVLVELGADTRKTAKGETAADKASKKGHAAIANYLSNPRSQFVAPVPVAPVPVAPVPVAPVAPVAPVPVQAAQQGASNVSSVASTEFKASNEAVDDDGDVESWDEYTDGDGLVLELVRTHILGHPAYRDGMSTAEVCEQIVKPKTAPSESSLTGLIGEEMWERDDEGEDDEMCGPADVYVVHAWGADFGGLVDALELYCHHHPRRSPNTRFWIDVLSLNQNKPPTIKPRDLSRFMRTTEGVVVVLPSRGGVHPLDRTWCVFEIATALRTRTPLSVAFEDDAVDVLERSLANLLPKLQSFGVENLNTSKSRDQRVLMHQLQKWAPKEDANKAWKEAMKARVVSGMQMVVAERVRKDLGSAHGHRQCEHMARLLDQYCILQMFQGNLTEATQKGRQAIDLWTQILGPADDHVIESLKHLSLLLKQQGEHTEAAAVDKDVAKRLGRLPEPPKANLDWATPIASGVALMNQDRFEEACVELEAALSLQERALGPNHPALIDTLTHLLNSLASQKKFSEALEHGERAVRIQEQLRDPAKLADLLVTSALLCRGCKRLKKATEYLTRALVLLRAQTPPSLKAIRNTLDQLGTVALERKNYEEAEPILRECLDLSERLFGVMCQQYAQAAINLGYALKQQGKVDSAAQLLSRAVVIASEVFGDNHPGTLHAAALLSDLAAMSR